MCIELKSKEKESISWCQWTNKAITRFQQYGDIFEDMSLYASVISITYANVTEIIAHLTIPNRLTISITKFIHLKDIEDNKR